MRVLLTTMPATAHLYPMVPLAWALQGAGHEVRVASHPDLVDTITAAGLTAVAVGVPEDLAAAVHASVDDMDLERITDAVALDPADTDRRTAIRHYMLAAFSLYYPATAGLAQDPAHRPMVDDLVSFARAWRPDLVLWDPLCFPSPIAARACGAAHARVLWGLDYIGWMRAHMAGGPARPAETDPMAERMRPTLERLGQDFDEELLTGQWTLDLMPQRMRLPADLRYLPVRRVPYNGAAAVPRWLHARPRRPRVCLTFGVSIRQFFQKHSGFPIADVLEMVSGLDIELVATLNEAQLAGVRAIPPNVRTIDYVPLNLLLPTCSAIVHHGGGGTFAAAVAHRVPQIIAAAGEGGDLLAIARYLTERGAGVTIAPAEFSVGLLEKQLRLVLDDPSFQAGATELYRDMLATPSPHATVTVLEKLTADRQRQG